MSDLITGSDAAMQVLRTVLLAIALVLAVICIMDWAVRTRRINPFGSVARFFRSTVDPFIVPIERRVVRAGGRPSSAPLWALGAVVVGGLLLIALLDFVTGQIAAVAGALARGPSGVLVLLISWTFALLR